MIISLSSLLLGLAAAAPAPIQDLRIEPRNELERRVLAPAEQATALTQEWLATFGQDRARLETELTGAGFALGREQGGQCRWFVYLRPIKSNGLERSAAVGLCPDKPFVLIFTDFLSSAKPPGPGAPGIRIGPAVPDSPKQNPPR
jgi:hypothetical protein